MTTGQTPKTRGQALGRVEKLAFQGLLARQRAVERESLDLQQDHNELLAEVEERLGLQEGALTSQPPTHEIDQRSWNVVEVEWAQPPEPTPAANGNGIPKIRTHADADRIAADLGLTLEEGLNVKQKVAAIELRRTEAAATAEV